MFRKKYVGSGDVNFWPNKIYLTKIKRLKVQGDEKVHDKIHTYWNKLQQNISKNNTVNKPRCQHALNHPSVYIQSYVFLRRTISSLLKICILEIYFLKKHIIAHTSYVKNKIDIYSNNITNKARAKCSSTWSNAV